MIYIHIITKISDYNYIMFILKIYYNVLIFIDNYSHKINIYSKYYLFFVLHFQCLIIHQTSYIKLYAFYSHIFILYPYFKEFDVF